MNKNLLYIGLTITILISVGLFLISSGLNIPFVSNIVPFNKPSFQVINSTYSTTKVYDYGIETGIGYITVKNQGSLTVYNVTYKLFIRDSWGNWNLFKYNFYRQDPIEPNGHFKLGYPFMNIDVGHKFSLNVTYSYFQDGKKIMNTDFLFFNLVKLK